MIFTIVPVELGASETVTAPATVTGFTLNTHVAVAPGQKMAWGSQ